MPLFDSDTIHRLVPSSPLGKEGMMDEVRAGATVSLPAQWAVFFRQWLKNPLSMASVVPSGRQLAQLMAAALPRDAGCVVELGAGTGAITEALIRHGVAPGNMLVVEMNAVLHGMLEQRFPRAEVLCGDACQLHDLVDRSAGLASGQVDAVVSSLGLLAIPRPVQRAILAGAFEVLKPGGVFVQYTYGLSGPLDRRIARQLGLVCRSAGWAWRNLPPARVFVYSRR